jgi:hypothetical protein
MSDTNCYKLTIYFSSGKVGIDSFDTLQACILWADWYETNGQFVTVETPCV